MIQRWLPMSRGTILMQRIDYFFRKVLGCEYLHVVGAWVM